jgi:hypothetical protein
MKKTTILALLFSQICFAITADQFECTFNFTSKDGITFQTKTQHASARVNIPSSSNEYFQTRGQFSWNQEIPTEQGFIKININYSYIHAIKQDYSEGRAYRCSDVKIETPSTGVNDFSCPEATTNPFEQGDTPWAIARIENKIASFPVRNWKFNSQLPEGNFSYSCIRLKTLN